MCLRLTSVCVCEINSGTFAGVIRQYKIKLIKININKDNIR